MNESGEDGKDGENRERVVRRGFNKNGCRSAETSRAMVVNRMDSGLENGQRVVSEGGIRMDAAPLALRGPLP